jgi:phosphate acetyltransferase
VGAVRAHVAEKPHGSPVYVLRDLPVLSALTVEEVVDGLGGVVLVGSPDSLQREVDAYVAGSGHLQTLLPILSDGALVVASGDRADLAVGAAASALSRDMPTPAGVLLTCGHRPDPMVGRAAAHGCCGSGGVHGSGCAGAGRAVGRIREV